jgi:lysophospholipase L1-like esterase
MKTLQIILLTLASFSGCARKADSTKMVSANNSNKTDSTIMANPNSLTYLALGDSYTIGQSVPQAQSFPYQLADLLKAQSLTIETPTIIATTGWTTDNLINAIANSGLTGKKYSFVTLLIGVNDQYQGISIDNYKVKFAQVLNTAIAFAGGDVNHVFVLSIPDYGVTPFANGQDAIIGPQIDAFNAVNYAVSVKAGVNYLNITAISKQAATNLNLVAGDGLHPSGAMYALWMQQLAPLVASQIKK